MPDLSILILQLAVGLTFAAHGAQKAFGWWGGPGLAGWQGAMANMGFQPARPFALLSTYVELVGGLMLAVGLLTPLAAAALLAQAIVIVGHVHLRNGFFNAQSGFEFPMLLGVGAASVGLAGPGAYSLDALLGLSVDSVLLLGILAAGVAAGLVALAIPRESARLAPTSTKRGAARGS